MKNITEFMTDDEANAYGLAAGLAAAGEKDRAAWAAGVAAVNAAKQRAIDQHTEPVKLNRRGLPYGGTHPALVDVQCLDISGCLAPA